MKRTFLALGALSLALALSGCTSATDMTTATSKPTSTATATPTPRPTTVLPESTNPIDGVTDGTAPMTDATVIPESTGVTSMDKARKAIEQIEEELERLSEVDDAEVIIAGSKAAVALEFDDQYRAGVDERLRTIVKERINGVVSGISTLAVTADEAVMDAIESLGEQLDTLSDMNSLESDVDAIIRKVNSTNA